MSLINPKNPKKIRELIENTFDRRYAKNYPIYYTVGDRIHFSDVAAYQDFTKNLKDEFLFHYGLDLFNDEQKWLVEPPQSIEYYRQQVCEYIENTYTNITIAYSGGTDSETVADAFKRRGTKNLKLTHAAMQDHLGMESKEYIFEHMRKEIKKKHTDAIHWLDWEFTVAAPWETNNESNFEKIISDMKIGAFATDHQQQCSWLHTHKDSVIGDGSKNKSVLIMGKEKPEISIHNGYWCFWMLNTHFELPPTALSPDADTFTFFMNDACPELVIKLAWTKAKEMEKIFLKEGLSPTLENSIGVNRVNSKYYTTLIEKMGYMGISDFLHLGSTKFGSPYWELVKKETDKISGTISKRNIILNKFFDEVLIDTIDNRFLNMNKKTPHSIWSKPIPLFPVDKKLY